MTDLKDRILDAALPNIVFDGWTQSTLESAAKSLGLTAFDLKRAFPEGPVDAANHFRARGDAEMLKILTRDHNLPALKIRERIATAVMVRLRLLLPHREAVRRGVGFYTMPWHTAAGLKALYATVDAMWKAAGDTSTDYNFYTKRLLLSGVYTSTLTVWLDDTSPDLAETEAFLKRRIENVMQIEKAKASAREHFSKLSGWMPDFKKNG
jgi:ubiquinone biosynthesis protein COQ9